MTISKGVVSQREKDRGKDYTPKQKKFLKLLVKNDFKDAAKCAKDAGYKNNYWQLISSLKEDIKEISEAMLLGSSPEAAKAMTDILSSDKPIANAAVKLSAARDVLDRSGIIKEEKSTVNHQVSGGIFLLPTKDVLPDIEAEFEEIEDEHTES